MSKHWQAEEGANTPHNKLWQAEEAEEGANTPYNAACKLTGQYRMQGFGVLRIILKYNRFEGVEDLPRFKKCDSCKCYALCKNMHWRKS
jgi:hypothetical protein